jgi:thiamine-monophosphate kinase
MRESEVIERLRRIATAPEARGLRDDVAVLGDLIVTHDSIAEGVHFLPHDPPASVGWKLVAVNLSDLAAKGGRPVGALLSLTISGAGDWEQAFLGGIDAACESYGLPLLGGDTIALPAKAPRVLGMTAFGRSDSHVPHRGGGKPGDFLWLVGTVGDAALGLSQLLAERHASGALVDIYRRPVPLLVPGEVLAPRANAAMDVSDGLLIDARRMAEASGCTISIELDQIPLSSAFVAERGQDRAARLFAATGGDDYALLFALPAEVDPVTLSLPSGTRMTRVGSLAEGVVPLRLTFGGEPVELPEKLGFEHAGIGRRNSDNRAPSAAPLGHRR